MQALVTKFLSAALGAGAYELVDEPAPLVADDADSHQHAWRDATADRGRPAEDPGVEVPHDALEPDTLRAVVEEFVSREGTDYGLREWSLNEKTAAVIRQLERGEAKLIFEPKSQSVNVIVNPRQVRRRTRSD